MTSNVKRAEAPGNVLIEKGEANLTKRCVANIPQLFTVDKTDLSEKIGTLPNKRLYQILEGISLLTSPRDI